LDGNTFASNMASLVVLAAELEVKTNLPN